jgi:hypothetical protein
MINPIIFTRTRTWNLALQASASWPWSRGRMNTIGTESIAAIESISFEHEYIGDARIILAIWGSTGNSAIWRPRQRGDPQSRGRYRRCIRRNPRQTDHNLHGAQAPKRPAAPTHLVAHFGEVALVIQCPEVVEQLERAHQGLWRGLEAHARQANRRAGGYRPQRIERRVRGGARILGGGMAEGKRGLWTHGVHEVEVYEVVDPCTAAQN